MLFIITTTTKKNWPNEPGVARDSFFLFFSFIYLLIELIELIEFNSVLAFLKDAREHGAHDCQSPQPGQVGPGLTVERGRSVCDSVCDSAIHTHSHDLARPRRRLQETQACSSQVSKKIEKSNKSRKMSNKSKESLLDPGRHFPVPYLLFYAVLGSWGRLL